MIARLLICVCLVAGAASCGGGGGARRSEAQGTVRIALAPIMTGELVTVTYLIVGKDGAGAVLWSEEVTSQVAATSDSQVDDTYAHECTSALDSIELTILRLQNADGATLDPSLYVAPPAVTQPVTCDGGTFSFEVTITEIRHGIETDVVFQDIFCSAKLDCLGDDGLPLELLHDAQGERSTTVVLALACTAGPDANNPGFGEATFLHMNDIYVACDDGSVYWIDPTAGADAEGGQAGPIPPLFYQHASYRGREQLPGLDKCFWNVALGIDLSMVTGDCHLEASGSASTRAIDDPVDPFGADDDPATLQLYPYIRWSIDLTALVDGEGRIACGRNPLGGFASGTSVDYFELTDTPFQHSFACQNGTTSRDPELCTRQLTGHEIAVQSIVGGVFVEIDDDRSELYALPDGLDIPDCCPTPCPDCNGGGATP